MTKLSVNVNKVAYLRNTRPYLNLPDVLRFARMALDAGAAGITVHPRPDQRHVKPDDVYAVADLLKQYPHAEFNIEGNPFYDYMHFAAEVHPTQCTLVPDSPDAKTSDQGWDLSKDIDRLKPVVKELKSHGCRVSLFMDPGSKHLDRAVDIGVDRIELYTEPYAVRFARNESNGAADYAATAREAQAVGLGVNAGHDLNLKNLGPFLSTVPKVLEVSISHALTADALEFGWEETIKRYLAITNFTSATR
ncbi:MAG TPA: pyridoxine 5'-phosphate synthase [Tepidisphaeraceae bacterium]